MNVKILLVALIFLLSCSSGSSVLITQPADHKKNEAVVLLHGLCRSNSSFTKMQEHLTKNGYSVYNVDYQSTKFSVEEISKQELHKVILDINKHNYQKIHFITHSLGGIIVRYYLKNYKLSNCGRVVMLAPPNQGSEITDFMGKSFVYKKYGGKAGQQLYTGKDQFPHKLGPVNFEVGIIAGNRTLNPILSLIIPGDDDGKVAVIKTKVPGMSDFIVVPHSHVFISSRDRVLMQSQYFLMNGKFKKY